MSEDLEEKKTMHEKIIELKDLCSKGKLDLVKKKIIDFNLTNDVDALSFCSAYAAKNGHLDVLKFLLKYKTDPNSSYPYLFTASENNHIDIIRFLVESDLDFDDDTIFRAITSSKDIKITKLLIDLAFDIQSYENILIKELSMLNKPDVIELILKAGADIHASNDFPLVIASAFGHLDVVKLYLDWGGADPTARNGECIKRAKEEGHIKIVEILEKHLTENS